MALELNGQPEKPLTPSDRVSREELRKAMEGTRDLLVERLFTTGLKIGVQAVDDKLLVVFPDKSFQQLPGDCRFEVDSGEVWAVSEATGERIKVEKSRNHAGRIPRLPEEASAERAA